MRIAFIGPGRLAQVLAPALALVGEAVTAISGPAGKERRTAALAAQLPGCLSVSPVEALERAELIFLTVPDDSIAAVAARLPWRGVHGVVHCSGATEIAALAPALAAGARVGGFHPLQIFSDTQRAAESLAGSRVAIEAEGPLLAELRRLAGALDMVPLTLPPGGRALYHAAANLAASSLLVVLNQAVNAWTAAGLPADQALPALLPLARGTLDAAAERGLAGALSGPVSRADLGVLTAHLGALKGLGNEAVVFYREMLLGQLLLAHESARLSPPQLMAIQDLLDDPTL